jgi:hypothetical protein
MAASRHVGSVRGATLREDHHKTKRLGHAPRVPTGATDAPRFGSENLGYAELVRAGGEGRHVILVDWQEAGFVPLTEHGTLYLGRAFGEATWTAFDLWPLREGEGVEARRERQKAWAGAAFRGSA